LEKTVVHDNHHKVSASKRGIELLEKIVQNYPNRTIPVTVFNKFSIWTVRTVRPTHFTGQQNLGKLFYKEIYCFIVDTIPVTQLEGGREVIPSPIKFSDAE
jgi:hypothetical protein